MMSLLYNQNLVDKDVQESRQDNIIASQKISKRARVTLYQSGKKVIKLYNTDILIMDNNKITLNSGGYRSVTTKARINQFLPCNISVYQKDYNWYIKHDGNIIEFFDGIELLI